MSDTTKTKAQLIGELARLRKRVSEFEARKDQPQPANEEMREPKEIYRAVAEKSLQGLLIAQGVPPRLVFVNSAAAHILGYTIEELLSLTQDEMIALLHPEDRSFFFQRYQDRIAGKSVPSQHEFRVIRKDGAVAWVEALANRITFQGEPAAQAAVIDVTDRKLAEEKLKRAHAELETRVEERTAELAEKNEELRNEIAQRKLVEETLREREERYRAIFTGTTEGIIYADKSGVVLETNEAFARITGIPYEKILGRHAIDLAQTFLEPAEIAYLIPLIENSLSGNSIKPYELHYRDKILEISTASLNEGTCGIAAIVRDITERKVTEERFRDLADSLPETVFEIDQTGTITFANRAGFETFGYNGKDFEKGLTALQMISSEDRERAQKNISRVMAGEKLGGVEYTAHRKDGTEFPVIIYSNAIVHDGKTVGLRGFVIDITERKLAEESLRDSEARYRALFQGTAEGILIADIETKELLYANPALCGLLGYREDELRRMSVQDIHPEEALEHVISEFEAQSRGEKILAHNIPCLRKDGSIIFADINTTLLLIDGRKCNVGFFTDITKRKESEEALRRSEETARVLLSAIPDTALLTEPDGTVVALNEKAARSLGKSQNHIIGMCVFDMFPADVAKYRKALSNQAIRSGKPVHFEDKRGDRWFDQSVYPVFDTQGKVMQLAIFARDITERKKEEKKLREREERWHKLLEISPNFITVVDRDGVVQFINRTVTGLTVEDAIGKDIYEYLQPEFHAPVREALERVFRTGMNCVYETKGLGPQGIISWYETHVAPIMQNGQVVVASLISTDITDRKRAEEEREKHIGKLEETVAKIKTVQGPVSICSTCKKVRDKNGLWHHVESYFRDRCEVEFVHGICPDCIKDILSKFYWDY